MGHFASLNHLQKDSGASKNVILNPKASKKLDVFVYLGGFLNHVGTPKSSMFKGFSIIQTYTNHPALGVLPFMEKPIQSSSFKHLKACRPVKFEPVSTNTMTSSGGYESVNLWCPASHP